MPKMKLTELVCDFDLYPRGQVDSQHVFYMRQALAAGNEFPPIVVDRRSKRIVDGFHRFRMFKLEGAAEVEAVLKDYKDEAALFLDAVRLNAAHGRMLSTFDRTRCALRAGELHIAPEDLASALLLTVEAAGRLITERVGRLRAVGPTGLNVPLKHTIAHMCGRTLTKAQVETNAKLGGMEAGFYVNQLIMLLRDGLIDLSDDRLVAKLRELNEALDSGLAAIA